MSFEQPTLPIRELGHIPASDPTIQWRGGALPGDRIRWGGDEFQVGTEYRLHRVVYQGVTRVAWTRRQIALAYTDADANNELTDDERLDTLDDVLTRINDEANELFNDPTPELDKYARQLANPFEDTSSNIE